MIIGLDSRHCSANISSAGVRALVGYAVGGNSKTRVT